MISSLGSLYGDDWGQIGVASPAKAVTTNAAPAAAAPTWYNPNGQQGNLLSNLNNLSGLTKNNNNVSYGLANQGVYDPISGSWTGGDAPWDAPTAGFEGYGQKFEPVIENGNYTCTTVVHINS